MHHTGEVTTIPPQLYAHSSWIIKLSIIVQFNLNLFSFDVERPLGAGDGAELTCTEQ